MRGGFVKYNKMLTSLECRLDDVKKKIYGTAFLRPNLENPTRPYDR